MRLLSLIVVSSIIGVTATFIIWAVTPGQSDISVRSGLALFMINSLIGLVAASIWHQASGRR